MAQKYPSGTLVVLAGTKRGLFLLSSRDREHWTVEPTALSGMRVYNAMLDQRAGSRIFAAENGDFFGNFIK